MMRWKRAALTFLSRLLRLDIFDVFEMKQVQTVNPARCRMALSGMPSDVALQFDRIVSHPAF